MSITLARVLLGVVLFIFSMNVRAGFTLTTIPPASWGAPDTTLGVAGYVIENFEDTSLVAGLQIGWSAGAGTIAPASTLPRTFDPRPTAQGGNDAHGNAFHSHPCGTAACTSVWDGSHVLVSGFGNQSHVYTASANWGDVDLAFTVPLRSIGFSLQQNELAVNAVLNGGTTTLTIPAAPAGGRFGYVRIDATDADVITSLRLDNSGGDGWAIDHLALAPVPEPQTYALMAAGLALIGCRLRRKSLRQRKAMLTLLHS